MDKLIDNRWVMRVFALFLAFMLYAIVNIESGSSVNKSPAPLMSSPAADKAIVTDVSVSTYFDQENLVVTGVPETVDVTLEGATGSLTKARKLKDFEIYADLTNLSIGTHRVNLKYKNLAEDLKANITPSAITVSIEEKVAKDFSVKVDLLNEDKIKEGYTPDQPIVNPNSIRVTASKNVLERIMSARATVNLENVKETTNKESRITIYDKDGNILPVEVEPSVVDITVPIKSPSKVLPFKISREGELGQGLSVVSIEPKPNEITVYGPLDVLDKLEFIDGVKVDLSKIKEDTVLEVEVPVPEGATKVNPEKIEIEIDIEKQEEKLFTDQIVKQVGLSEGKILEFVNPETGVLDVKVYGAPSVIEGIKPEDIEVYVNLTDLSDGEHEVKVEVNGPQNMTWSLQQEKVKMKISSAS